MGGKLDVEDGVDFPLQGAPAKVALVRVLDARPKLLHLQLAQAAFEGQVG